MGGTDNLTFLESYSLFYDGGLYLFEVNKIRFVFFLLFAPENSLNCTLKTENTNVSLIATYNRVESFLFATFNPQKYRIISVCDCAFKRI